MSEITHKIASDAANLQRRACSWIIIGIVLWGAVLRLSYLGSSSYWIDEGFTLMQMEVIKDHIIPLLASGSLEWKDLLIPYLTIIFFWWADITDTFALRLIPALFGVATIFVGYVLAKRMFSLKAGYAFALFLASGYWFVAWSQQVRGYSALLFFVLLFFLCFVMFVQTDMRRYFWAMLGATLFAFFAKSIGILLVIPLFYCAMRARLWHKKEGIAILLMVTFIIYVFTPHFAQVVHVQGQSHLLWYLQEYLWSTYHIFFVLGVVGWGIAWLRSGTLRVVHESIAVFASLTIVILSYFIDITEKRYLLIVTPFIFLYTSYLLSYAFAKTRYTRLAFSVVFALLFFVGCKTSLLLIVPNKHYALEENTPQPNYAGAYSVIKREVLVNRTVVVSTIPWMDLIYLGKSDFALSWSLTGRDTDETVTSGYERYSGVREISTESAKKFNEDLQKIRQENDVVVIMDALSRSRITDDIRDAISQGDQLFAQEDVYVYTFARVDVDKY